MRAGWGAGPQDHVTRGFQGRLTCPRVAATIPPSRSGQLTIKQRRGVDSPSKHFKLAEDQGFITRGRVPEGQSLGLKGSVILTPGDLCPPLHTQLGRSHKSCSSGIICTTWKPMKYADSRPRSSWF